MSESYNKLIKTLQSLFEMDKADLDFGIYRIMNQKRDEINRFLEQDLLPQVSQAFADYAQNGQHDLQQELNKAIEQAKSFGAPDPENTPAVLAIKEKMQNSVDSVALENEIYSHLNTFFSRYYDKGDFISQRRYKKDTYAIPYEGEEVKLYWANQDQYYIKSSEHLRDYAFLAHADDDKSVHIKLVEADIEKDNTKAKAGEERRFVLDSENPLSVENDELIIHFHYIPAGKQKQDKLNQEAVKTILAQTDYADWLAVLKTPAPTEKNPNRTLLEKHLTAYTARNTYDYFIHKDLGGFLRRELDFYIKNEVLFLDDIDDAAFNVTEQHLRKIKVIRSIALKLIRMLAQLEDFQKKLWLKKKFVVATNYCLTLDRIDELFYPDIAACDAQWHEWVSLGFITTEEAERTDKRAQLLKEQPSLIVDTQFFPPEWKDKLIASIDNLDEQCEGLLVHSENFQALNLLRELYKKKVDCIYIDPPYNTGGGDFTYKDKYQNSSWASMIQNRLEKAIPLLSDMAVFFVSIDDNEAQNLRLISEEVFGKKTFESQIIIQSNKRGQTYQSVAKTHEYLLVFGIGESFEIHELSKEISDKSLEDEYGTYELWELRNRNPKFGKHNRPNLYYPIYIEDLNDAGYANISLTKSDRFSIEVFPKNSTGEDSCWRWGKDKVRSNINSNLSVLVGKKKRDGGWNIYEKSRKGSTKAKSIWLETNIINEQGTIEVGNLGFSDFGFPKPVSLLKKVFQIGTINAGLILDFFSGSGTTAHAAINLNREDNGQRKYILVEMGDYFNTVLKPRLQKVVYSKDWKDGKPKPDKDDHFNGISHCFKYLKLESYEDTLNNLKLKAHSKGQRDLLNEHQPLREDYLLGYWLDVETKDSASLLNLDRFEDPFSYQLNIATGSAGVTQPIQVDLVETFNYLLGLTVKHIDVVRGFKIVTGINPKEESVLVIWCNLKQQDNAALETFMDKSGYNPRDTKYDHIYINGDHTLDDPHSKVKMIEIEFKRLMFDVQDV